MNPFFSMLFSASTEFVRGRQAGLASAMKSVVRYPLNAVATLLFAPFLAVRVARIAKNPIRRMIAGVGLLTGVAAAYVAGTFVGKTAFALFMFANFGFSMGLGVLIGSLTSVIVSGTIIALAFNGTCLLFLKMSAEDVVAHLKSASE
jgi:hypothetical protein